MKIKILFILLYLLALQVLPSVRAMKLVFSTPSEITFFDYYPSKSDCEKGNFIMNLNFSPTQIVSEFIIREPKLFLYFYIKIKSNFYKLFHVKNILFSIWHPPIFFHFIKLV